MSLLKYKLLNIVDGLQTFEGLTNKSEKSLYFVKTDSGYLLYKGNTPINLTTMKPATSSELGAIKGSTYLTVRKDGSVVVNKANRLSRKVKLGDAYFDGSSSISLLEIGAISNIEFNQYKITVSDLFEKLQYELENHTHSVSDIIDFPTSLPANGGNADTLNNKKDTDFANSVHKHSKSDITDFPESLPANGGNADTLDNKHAADFANATHKHTKSDISDFPTSLPANGGNSERTNGIKITVSETAPTSPSNNDIWIF